MCYTNKVLSTNPSMEVTHMNENIVIKGAREHNLRNVDVTIPRDKRVVMTGRSG